MSNSRRAGSPQYGITFFNLSNSVSTGCGANRTETPGDADLDFFEGEDDEGSTGAVVGSVEVGEIDGGTGSGMGNEETGSM